MLRRRNKLSAFHTLYVNGTPVSGATFGMVFARLRVKSLVLLALFVGVATTTGVSEWLEGRYNYSCQGCGRATTPECSLARNRGHSRGVPAISTNISCSTNNSSFIVNNNSKGLLRHIFSCFVSPVTPIPPIQQFYSLSTYNTSYNSGLFELLALLYFSFPCSPALALALDLAGLSPSVPPPHSQGSCSLSPSLLAYN